MSFTEKTMFKIFDMQLEKIEKQQEGMIFNYNVDYTVNETFDYIRPKTDEKIFQLLLIFTEEHFQVEIKNIIDFMLVI